jgi:hypothetical protein
MADITITQLPASEPVAECTPEQGKQWQTRYTDGYCHGRRDARDGRINRAYVVAIPAELPMETGAQYVTRHLGQAWEIGYTAAVHYQVAHGGAA